jgi:hypothetical protein
MRVAGEAIARQAGIENGDLASPARPAKLPPMMMTSSMVISSVLCMQEVGLSLAQFHPAMRTRWAAKET